MGTAPVAGCHAYADLSAKVHLSYGTTTAEDYTEQMLVDLAVHRWDLQRGANVGEGMDGAVVTHVIGLVRAHPDEFAVSGTFKPPIPTNSAFPHDQLLALLGRDPAWRRPGH